MFGYTWSEIIVRLIAIYCLTSMIMMAKFCCDLALDEDFREDFRKEGRHILLSEFGIKVITAFVFLFVILISPFLQLISHYKSLVIVRYKLINWYRQFCINRSIKKMERSFARFPEAHKIFDEAIKRYKTERSEQQTIEEYRNSFLRLNQAVDDAQKKMIEQVREMIND